MIVIKKGDVTEAKEGVIFHQVNCKGRMNSGVAKAIRNKYPKAFEEYYNKCTLYNISSHLLGTAQVVECDSKIVVNLFGQTDYGYNGVQYTDIDALENAMLEALLEIGSGQDIAMPYKIGCGLGGADWNEVYSMIVNISNIYKGNIVLYQM